MSSSTFTSHRGSMQDPCQGQGGAASDAGVGPSSPPDESLTPPALLPIDALRCPLCGGPVKWSCGSEPYPTGRAECEAGPNVSYRAMPESTGCLWAGIPTRRVDGHVFAVLPLEAP